MKILVVHNFHRKGSASGDYQVFKRETALLEAHGNEIVTYTVSNDEFDNSNVLGKMGKTFGMLWSFQKYVELKKLILREKPDIVHVHTFFPLLSPSILYAAKRENLPVVATIHDTRFVCPCATSLRNGKLCNECGDGHYFRMCQNKCFKDSRLQSFIVAFIFKYHRIRRSFYNQIDKYICLNDNQIKLLKEIGFDTGKITKKYNFVQDGAEKLQQVTVDTIPERYVVFYGRVGEEKGIRLLMKMWDQITEIPLVVMGDGPLNEEFLQWSKTKKNVYHLGYTQHEKCLSIVKKSEFVVFPSIWYEGCSMVEIESESLGKALVATDLGFSAEAIKDEYNGYKIQLGDVDTFVRTIRNLWNSPQECIRMGKNARKEYELKYMPEDNYKQLMGIYNELLEQRD